MAGRMVTHHRQKTAIPSFFLTRQEFPVHSCSCLLHSMGINLFFMTTPSPWSFSSFNYRKGFVHLVSPESLMCCFFFFLRWHLGHELSSTQTNTPAGLDMLWHVICVPWTFYVTYASDELWTTWRIFTLAFDNTLVWAMTSHGWNSRVSLVHNCWILINTTEASLSGEPQRVNSPSEHCEQKDVN